MFSMIPMYISTNIRLNVHFHEYICLLFFLSDTMFLINILVREWFCRKRHCLACHFSIYVDDSVCKHISSQWHLFCKCQFLLSKYCYLKLYISLFKSMENIDNTQLYWLYSWYLLYNTISEAFRVSVVQIFAQLETNQILLIMLYKLLT